MDRTHGRNLNRFFLPMVDEHLIDFAAHASASLGGASSCSITMDVGGRLRRSASSDVMSAACDDMEVTSGVGPCLDAMAFGQVVMIDDVGAALQWPEWAAVTKAAGFLSAGAFPGHARSGAAVAVNVYRQDVGPWSLDDIVRADVYAQQVARVVDLCLQVGNLDEQRRTLSESLEAQRAIDHAIGVVMVTNRCDAATALAVLRSGATNLDVTLPEVAVSVLESLVPPQHPAER